MSTDPRPPGAEDRSGPRPAAIGIAAGVLVILLVILVIVLTRGDGDQQALPEPSLTATPLSPSPTPVASPTPSPTPTVTPTPTAEPTTPDATAPTGPTDADAAAFANSYRPEGATDVRTLQADLNADGASEVVVTSIIEAQQSVRVDIGAWTGERYEAVFAGQGGSAQTYEFTVRDYTGDEFLEVVTEQSVGAQGQSLSIWGWDGAGYGPQIAQGGCWDGTNTYGIIGASIRTGEITATCDGSPLPTAAWPSDVYVWDGSAWTFERTEPPA